MSDAAAQPEPAQQLEPNPVPPCPECQAICVVRLPEHWAGSQFHCNKCAHQWWEHPEIANERLWGAKREQEERERLGLPTPPTWILTTADGSFGDTGLEDSPQLPPHLYSNAMQQPVTAEDLGRVVAAAIQTAKEQLIAAVPASNPIAPEKHRTTGKQISDFDDVAGKLMVDARNSCSTRTLPKSVIDGILGSIDSDSRGFTPSKCLEGKKRQQLNDYNRDHPHDAIKTFKAAAKHRLFRRAVQVRLGHARDNYKEATGDVS